MSVVALASVKGSPGVTTAAVAIAASWPEDRSAIIAELDPAGGDLAVRFGLAEEPGLVSWAAAARRSSAVQELSRHLQELPGGVDVLVAPTGSEQAGAALRLLEQRSHLGLNAYPNADLLLDLGRLGFSRSPHPFLAEVDLLLLLVRPTLADLAHLAARVEALQGQARDLALVLVGPGPYTSREIAATLGAEVLGDLPLDPQGAGLCSGLNSVSARAAARSPLLRAARTLALGLAARLGAELGGRIATEEQAKESGPWRTAAALEGTL